jgi:hypothetical protein
MTARVCHIFSLWHALNLLGRKGFLGRMPPCHTQPESTDVGTPLKLYRFVSG